MKNSFHFNITANNLEFLLKNYNHVQNVLIRLVIVVESKSSTHALTAKFLTDGNQFENSYNY